MSSLNAFSCGERVVLPPVFPVWSATGVALNDCRLSSRVESGRSVRKNPKDSGLGKLRAPQVVEHQDVSTDSGPR
jgi:hypothetical protein